MKKIVLLYYLISILVGIAVCVLTDITRWKDALKTLITGVLAASIVFLVGRELAWSVEKTMAGIIIASCYSRPVVYGLFDLLKEFFTDPQKFIEKYKGK